MFCTRCKRNSHYVKDCRAKTFKGGKTQIGKPQKRGSSRKTNWRY